MKQKILLLSFILFSLNINAQTNISGGNVFGKWTKANSPYRINGNITIPKDSTLSIEPGVSIQFGPRKHLKVDGRILALGKAKSTDSIWFTRQNTHDTNYWRGIKFINTSNSNDTSIFKHCVFNHCKSLFDSTKAFLGGVFTIFNYGKVKLLNNTFYKNESNIGTGVYLSNNAYCLIKSCNFKNNIVSQFFYFNEGFYQAHQPKGSGIAVELNSNVDIDSCVFKTNYRGKQYLQSPSILYEASVVDVRGSTYDKQKAYATITNSIFDGNEGIVLYADDRAVVNVNNCSFVNAPKDKSLHVIFSTDRAEVYTRKCSFQNNASNTLIVALGGIFVSFSDIVSNNVGFKSIYASQRNPASSMNSFTSLTNTQILNNKADLSQLYTGRIVVEKIVGCLIANNECPTFLEAQYIYNSTIVNNYSSATLIDCNSIAWNFKNNIIWGNKCDSSNGRQITIRTGSEVQFANNIIENDSNNFRKAGNSKFINSRGLPINYFDNISENPQFENPTASYGVSYNAANADFRLKSSCSIQSPGINAGHPDTVSIKLHRQDIAGNTRFFENKIDIGAFENVSGSPQIKILKQTLKDSLCEKSRAAMLSISAIGKGLSYQWQQSNNAGSTWTNMSGTNSNKLTVSNTHSTQNNVLYRALLSGTCDKDTSKIMEIITFDLPDLNLGKDTSVCQHSTISKMTNSVGTFLWHTGNTSNYLSQKMIKDSLWWLQVTSPKGCKVRDSIFITNISNPIVDLGEDRNLYKDEEMTLNAGAGDYTYLWNNGSTSQYRTFKGQDLGVSGDYNLWAQVSNKQGCASRDSIKVTLLGFTSLNPINQMPISIYPLPAQDYLNINIPLQWFTNPFNLTIKSIDGKVIQQQEITKPLTTLPVSHLKSGIYLISINNGSENIHLKWVKQ